MIGRPLCGLTVPLLERCAAELEASGGLAASWRERWRFAFTEVMQSGLEDPDVLVEAVIALCKNEEALAAAERNHERRQREREQQRRRRLARSAPAPAPRAPEQPEGRWDLEQEDGD